ncbi:MAM and LDL-receptor class A domain-containing protein 1-like isoform X2 [Tubulanus polymorphus]
MESSPPARRGNRARFEANIQSASDACVMNFYYHMYGSTMGRLQVKLNGDVLFSKSGNQGNQWKLGSVPIAKGNAAIEFVAIRGSYRMSDIAIDDVTFTTGCSTVTPAQLTTDFETDIGMWNSRGTLEWTRQSGNISSSTGTGPSGDHTTGNGTYVHVETSGKHVDDQAKFEANTLSMSDSCVMNFYYHMHGSTTGKLEVKLNGNVLFSQYGDQGNQWKHGSVKIVKGNAAIQFVATLGSGDKSNIAVDDVRFTKECTATPEQLTTDFETDFGKWNSQGTLQWTRRSGSTTSSNTGPRGDHTTGSGTYVYLDTSGKNPGDRAIFAASTQSASDACTMKFYYHMYGSTIGTLEVYLNGKIAFSKSGNRRNRWKMGSVYIAKGNAVIQFVATRGSARKSDIAVDDVTFTTGCTTTIKATPEQLATDFETDNGMWFSPGKLQWKRLSGNTPTSYTGPSGDHTTGNGKYLYVDASGKNPGDQSRFEANTRSASDYCIMNFYYHMEGFSMGKLEVKINGIVLFSKSGNQRDQWKQGSVNIAKGNATIQFVATRGRGYRSDIAIDDVTFSTGCTSPNFVPGAVFIPVTGSIVAPEQLATDFETNNGKWNSQGTIQWRRQSGSALPPNTGPSRDHTTGNGNYLYMVSTWEKTGDQARLEANTRSASDSCDMNFYYHMYGLMMGKLEVKLNEKVAFSQSGDKGDQWRMGSVKIGQGNVAIQFVATRGRSPMSDIAIDDITFSPGCTTTIPVTSPNAGT